jgi:hypothetical protein
MHIASVSLLEVKVEETWHLRLWHLPVESCEVRVFHGICDCDTVIWVESEHLLQEIDRGGVGGRGKE